MENICPVFLLAWIPRHDVVKIYPKDRVHCKIEKQNTQTSVKDEILERDARIAQLKSNPHGFKRSQSRHHEENGNLWNQTCILFIGLRYIIPKHQVLEQVKSNVKYRCKYSGISGILEEGLHNSHKPKETQTIAEEKCPHKRPVAVLEQETIEHACAQTSDNNVYDDIVQKPTEPVCKFAEAHHSHAVSYSCLFLRNHSWASAEDGE